MLTAGSGKNVYSVSHGLMEITSKELEDSFGGGNGKQQYGINQKLVPGDIFVEIVGGLAEYQRKQNPDAIR